MLGETTSTYINDENSSNFYVDSPSETYFAVRIKSRRTG